MANESHLTASDLDTASWKILNETVRKLEAAWQQGLVEGLSELAASVPDPIRVTVLAELVKVDQECAWQRGERRLIEDYFEAWPELSSSAARCLELLRAECLTRAALRNPATSDEIRRRFPELADQLDLKEIEHQSKTEATAHRAAMEVFSAVRSSTPRPDQTTPEIKAFWPDELSGERVGDYELLRELGRGGMGVVYEAQQMSAGRIVALKLILSGRLAAPNDIRRFQTEAEAAARLDHSNIVPIYHVGNQGGLHYFSMRFIEGKSLQQLLMAGPLEFRRAAEVVQIVARAVHHAHEKGILHRDLKPTNILIGKDGQPHLTDFGLAKYPDSDQHLTATDQALGTPGYMSPEQIGTKQGELSPAADVYGLGAILYCCLTGRPPFQAARSLETMQQVLREDPASPRSLNSRIPRDLEIVCLKCLRKSPQERYASAADLAEDLGRYLNGEPIEARPISPVRRFVKWCRREPWKAVAVTLPSALCAILVYQLVAIDAARSREKSARVYAQEVFDWSTDSIGRLENAIRNHERFVKDDSYRDLQAELLTISKDHYQRIAQLNLDDREQFPFLESKRGNAYWWLGVVELWHAQTISSDSDKKSFFEEALSQFTEMQMIYRRLLSQHLGESEYQFRYGWSCGCKAMVLNELGRGQDVRRECEQGIEVLTDCPHPEAKIKLGACYLELAIVEARQGNAEEADQLVDTAADLLDSTPFSDDPFIQGDRLYFRKERVAKVASILVEAGSYRGASRMFLELANDFPEEPRFLYHACIADLAAGDEISYKTVRKTLLARFGDGEEPSDRIAYAYAPVPLNEGADAERSKLTKAVANFPDPRCRAAIFYRLGDFEEALACLNERNDGRAWDQFLFALCYAQLGNDQQAQIHYLAATNWIETAQQTGEHIGWEEAIETEKLRLETERLSLSEQ